jgi:hypothetical protein
MIKQIQFAIKDQDFIDKLIKEMVKPKEVETSKKIKSLQALPELQNQESDQPEKSNDEQKDAPGRE